MTEADVEVILQRAREEAPEVQPRIITDNGPQFVSRDLKAYIRLCGMTHGRTAPYSPQSNGKIERWHKSIKRECIRPGTLLSLKDACKLADRFKYYNDERLHGAIGYVIPRDKLEGREKEIFVARRRSWQKRAGKVWQASRLMLKFLCGASRSARLRQHHAPFSVLFWMGKTPFQAEPVHHETRKSTDIFSLFFQTK